MLELTAAGSSAHGAEPYKGINAISRLVAFLAELGDFPESDGFLRFLHEAIGHEWTGESLGIACQDPVHGEVTVNLARIRADAAGSEAVINVRYPVTVREEDILDGVRQKASPYGVGVEVLKHLPSVHVPPEHPLIAKLSRSYETVTGKPARLLSISGGTYAKKLRNRGVAFGAGVGGNVHQPDEFIPIAGLMEHAVICLQAVHDLSMFGEEESS